MHVCIHERARYTWVCMYWLCMWRGQRSTPGVIPQVPSSLFRDTGSVAGLELNKWLTWLAIKPRGVYLSQPPQDWGSHTQTTISSLETKFRSSCLARGTGSQKPARPTEAATSRRDLPMDHRTETLPLSSRVAGQDGRVCPCPHLS